MLKILKRLMVIVLTTFAVIALFVYAYTKQEKFGAAPSGERLEKIKKSPNYLDGEFKNQSYTPSLAEGTNYFEVTWEYLFKSVPNKEPSGLIPSVKTDLLNLALEEDVLVWFGHSSYFIQIDGKRILVDPVFSGNASPIPGSNKAFEGTDIYNVDDLPEIDLLFISHDHYDHLDHETILKLRSKVNQVVCGLGVGAHFERWGFSMEKVFEMDWNDSLDIGKGFSVVALPARHFSGRAFSINNTLWMSLLLKTPTMKIYLGGDSGYDKHYAKIGETYGPIDLAILDNGQYDLKWKYIHHLPEEVLKATKDLQAKRLFPVHSSKFILANHPWDEPLNRISELAQSNNIPLLTPIIGQKVNLKDEAQKFDFWWSKLDELKNYF